ncbi:MAG: lamin tail domain-containing protein, partial [Thermoplasmata archaeon]|nr:lamin tail domain-containing protein [Thermoplasmata archaeon]
LSDIGVITNEVFWNYITQTHLIYRNYLTIYHDAYPSGGGNTEVASGYGFGGGDFTVEEPNTYLHSGSTQETYSSFIQTGVSGVSNDLRIYQRAFSKEGEDWAVLMWKLENIYGQDIYDLRVGMNFRTRIADTPANDIDYWNAADSTYYVVDSPTGSTFMGLATGDPTYPLNHYYGDAAGTQGAVDPADDRKLYQALITNQVHGSSAEITCMVGWEVGFLPAGENVTLPLVIGFGTNYQEVATEVTDSQQFLNLHLTKLMITEIQDSVSTGSVKIEIYNNGGREVSTSDIYLSPDGTTQWTAGTWSTGSVLPGKHATYSLGPGESFASIEGGNISLHNLTGSVFDWVAFGQEGPAPDPIVDESIARFWGGMNYTDDWVRDPTPTFGTYNNRMGRRDPPPVVLSEVYFNAHSLNERFIELYYPGNSSRDLSGWTVVVDSEYALPAYTMDANNRHFVLRGEDFPIAFDMDDGISYGDNVYLYNDLGELTDMVGWSSAHIKGQSMTRLENETLWGFDGYDDISSLQAGWRFNRTPTPMIISIGPDQSMFATLGEVVDYYVFLRNFGSGPDCFDLTFISTLGWETSVTDSLGNPIVDHDSDGVPDSDPMAPRDVLSLRVSVTAPMNTDDGNYNAVYLTATSSVNAKVRGTVVLKTTV